VSLLGLDIGTSGSKGLLLGTDGHELGTASIEHRLSFPRRGWVELDPDTVWDGVQSIIARMARVGGKAGDAVQALAFSVSGDEAVPVDAVGHVLYPCIMAMDVRTRDLAGWWQSRAGAEVLYDLTGLPPAPNWPLLRLMWIRENEPQAFATTSQMLCWEDLMVLRLTGEPVTDHSVASRTMAFDIKKRNWSQEILDIAGINPAVFPRSVQSSTAVGVITPKMARELGLNDGVQVVAGGFDQAMAALGAGLIRPGDAVVGTGTWEALTILTAAPATGAGLWTAGYASGCYVAGDLYYCLASNPGGGSVLRWFRDTFGQPELELASREGCDAFDLIMRQVPDGPTGMLVLPHFEGSYTPWMDPSSTGAILGLRLSTTRGQVVKALLEGITFELMENIIRLEEAGVAVGDLRATGGGARSPVWLQLKADITGRPVSKVAGSEAGCLAAAILAGVGIGVFSSIHDTLACLVQTAETYYPRSRVHEAYQEPFARYRKLYATLRPLVLEPDPEAGGTPAFSQPKDEVTCH
jgi:xylulokinase